ncbi:MAG: hypothetical protein WD929_10295 [Steroidobacteraceae bacterium]
MLDEREAAKIKRQLAKKAREDQLNRRRTNTSARMARKSDEKVKKHHTGKRRSVWTVQGGAVERNRSKF